MRGVDEEDLAHLFHTRELDTVAWRAPSRELVPEGTPTGATLELVVTLGPPGPRPERVRLGVTYLPRGPVVAGIQNAHAPSELVFRVPYKPDSELGVVTDSGASVAVRLRGRPSYGMDDPGADNAVSELRRAYAVALAKLGIDQIGGTSDDASKNAAHAAIRKDGELIDKWASDYRTWATNGKRPDGTSYGWAQWYGFGRNLASDLTLQTGVAYDATLFSVVVNTTDATATQVKDTAVKAAEKASSLLDFISTPLGTFTAAAVVVGVLALKAK